MGIERSSYEMTDQVRPYLSRDYRELLVEKTVGKGKEDRRTGT